MPWSGGLFLTHSLYSYNPRSRYDIQTEIVAGIMGPASLAGALQKGFHRLIHYTLPTGWGHQFRNDLLLNINLTLEKQLLELRPGADPLLELIGGGAIHAGTMENRLSFYSLLRLGLMHPYFNGLLSQYTSGGSKEKKDHIQLYFFARPQADLVCSNAILEGGMFTHPPHAAPAKTSPQSSLPPKVLSTYQPLRTFTYSMDYGAVLALRTWSLSFTQSWSSALMRGLYNHEVGNLTLYFAL
ncbi:lipid A-modifier LpxR family protein [Puia sp. P3]|uniref:lipid A-modifier LpxR family protein n=1 Tax=Puia sp. P3 TaxID=3423952 RepID=UPI003D66F765